MSTLAFRMTQQSEQGSERGRFWITFFFGALMLVLGAWSVAYSMGIAPWLGYAKQSEVFVGERSGPQGLSIGPRTFGFVKGQRVFVSYDLQRADAGALEVRVVRRGDLTPDPSASLTLERSSKGRHVYRVPKSGLYTVALHCLPGAKGCDIAYRATWGGLPASDTLNVAEAELGQWSEAL